MNAEEGGRGRATRVGADRSAHERMRAASLARSTKVNFNLSTTESRHTNTSTNQLSAVRVVSCFPRARPDPTHAPWARRRNHSPRYGGAPCTLKRGMLCAASSRGCCSDCCCWQQPPRHTNDHFSQDHRAAPREETRAKRNQRARSSCDELPHSSWTSGDATRFA